MRPKITVNYVAQFIQTTLAKCYFSRCLVRLVGSGYLYEGRLEVYYGGTWGTVCDDDFSDTDARVFCYRLGFGYVNIMLTSCVNRLEQMISVRPIADPLVTWPWRHMTPKGQGLRENVLHRDTRSSGNDYQYFYHAAVRGLMGTKSNTEAPMGDNLLPNVRSVIGRSSSDQHHYYYILPCSCHYTDRFFGPPSVNSFVSNLHWIMLESCTLLTTFRTTNERMNDYSKQINITPVLRQLHWLTCQPLNRL